MADFGSAYSELGEVLDQIARRRHVRGPHTVARYIHAKTGRGPNGSAWQQIFTGETKNPKRETIKLFAEAFELDQDERRHLADTYTYAGSEDE